MVEQWTSARLVGWDVEMRGQVLLGKLGGF